MKRYEIIKHGNGDRYSVLKSDDKYNLNIFMTCDILDKKEVFISDSGNSYNFNEANTTLNLRGYGLKEIDDDELCLLLME